ncbi:hypothetical protein [Corynebacterium ulceribovis]|uniref:hypothetical protein n=1 Tax=Corynebacterium ulceribovis TaxID=487732 RepID=UPI000379C22A|nr:hypothetical protein [Corynebacterium ulceribovis]
MTTTLNKTANGRSRTRLGTATGLDTGRRPDRDAGRRLPPQTARGRRTAGFKSDGAPERQRRRRIASRTGSKQILSIRGRRIAPETADPSMIRFVIAILLVGTIGIALAMALSAISTEQSFRLSDARSKGQLISDEIETLQRDVEHARSTAEISRRAGEMGMVQIKQPGVLEVRKDGKVVEKRPADVEKQGKLADINGEKIRPKNPTSDPKETDNVPGMTPPGPPESRHNQPAPNSGLAPYTPGMQNDVQAQGNSNTPDNAHAPNRENQAHSENDRPEVGGQQP